MEELAGLAVFPHLLKQGEGIPPAEECSKESPVHGLGPLIITQAVTYKIFPFPAWVLRLNSFKLNVFEVTGLCSNREKV